MNIPAVFVAIYVIGLLVTLFCGWVYGYTRGTASADNEGIDLDALDRPRHAADAHHFVPPFASDDEVRAAVEIEARRWDSLLKRPGMDD